MTELDKWFLFDVGPINEVINSTEDFVKYYVYDITLHAGKYKVDLYLVKPKEGNKLPGVHFIHWLETHAENSNKRQFLPMAKSFAEKGIVSILPDCFWSLEKEDYDKNPSKYTSNWWKTDKERDLNLIFKQLAELKIVDTYFRGLELIDNTRLGLGAHDFGAMFACLLASSGSKYSVYAFMAMTSRFSDWFRFGSQLPDIALSHYESDLEFAAPINHIMNLSPSPLHLGFADDDFYVPIERAEAIFEAAQEPKKITWYSAKHGMNKEAYSDLQSWLERHLFT